MVCFRLYIVDLSGRLYYLTVYLRMLDLKALLISTFDSFWTGGITSSGVINHPTTPPYLPFCKPVAITRTFRLSPPFFNVTPDG